MDTDATIRMLNAITAPYFTNGGHHTPTGNIAFDHYVLAASHTREALDPHHTLAERVCYLLGANTLAERVCYLLGAKEEIGHMRANDVEPREKVLNAIAWATSVVCDEIRALESRRRK